MLEYRVFHALGDPSRMQMVERLSRGPASVSEIAAPFSMSLAAVVQHLQVLEECGVIRSKKEGRVRTCMLDHKRLGAAEQWLNERRAQIERKLDRLGELLDEQERKEKKS